MRFAVAAVLLLLPVAPAFSQNSLTDPPRPLTIEAVRRLGGSDTGGVFTVAGRASVGTGVFNTGFTTFHVQDATGGIGVFSRTPGPPVRLGDSLIVTGRLSRFRGRLQLADPVYRLIPGPARIPAPAPLDANPREFPSRLGQLVRVEARIIGRRSTSAGDYLLLGDDSTRSPLEVFVGRSDRSDVLLRVYEPGERVRVTGIFEPFDGGTPPTRSYQLYPRSPSDVRVLGISRAWQRRVGSIVAAALAIALIWVLALHRTVAARTRTIRSTKDWHRAILENMTDEVVVLDPAGRIKYSSQSATGIHGYTSEERVGRSGFELVHPEDAPRITAVFADLGRSLGAVTSSEVRLRHKDGGYRRVRAVGRNMLADPVVNGIIVTFTDITERTAAEAERDRLFTVSPDLLGVMDMEGILRRVNPAFEATLGYSEAEVCGRPVSEFLHPDYAEVWEQEMAKLLAGETVRVEVQFRAPDGTFCRLSLIAAPDAATDRTYVVGRDVTAERERQDHAREAQKMEAVGRLAGGIAHDFNNLLTAVLSYADFLHLDTAADDPRKADIEQIQAAAARASELTKQLLAFSRGSKTEMTHVDLNSLLEEVQRMLHRLIGEQIDMVVRLEPGLPAITADKGQIDQLVLNLALNARDAMPAGGALVLQTESIRLAAGEWLDYSGEPVPVGSYVVLTVSDTGQGMDPATMEKMFEPFFTTKGVGRGTGLGLATVYGILRQNGGFVRVKTIKGRGTRFEVLFPTVDEVKTRQRGMPLDAIIPEADDHATVLVAEDESAVREALERILKAQGYSVLTAKSGDEGARMFAGSAEEINLLVTDVVMPGLGGYELAASCLSRKAGLPVLFLSGYAGDHPKPGSNQPARSAFLYKPFTRAALITAVRDLLSLPVESPSADGLSRSLLG